VVHHSLAVAIGNGLTEENQVRELTIDSNDSRISGGHEHEFGADVVSDELAQSFRFGGFRFDREDPAHVRVHPLARSTESQLMCHDCRVTVESCKFPLTLMLRVGKNRKCAIGDRRG
jgi:hypothetical protein